MGVLDLTGCVAMGVTGPVLRSAGLPWDLRKTMPYCGYETYDFDVPTATTADVWARYQILSGGDPRVVEDHRAGGRPPEAGPATVVQKTLRLRSWPSAWTAWTPGARREDHGTVDGVADPSFQAGDRGLPARPASTRRSSPRAANWARTPSPTAGPGPYRVHFREPSFINLQALPAMAEGALLADIIAGASPRWWSLTAKSPICRYRPGRQHQA